MPLDELAKSAYQAMRAGDVVRAAEFAMSLESELATVSNALIHAKGEASLGAVLIDLGDLKGNEQMVEKGTRLAEAALSTLPEAEHSVSHYYNAANGNSGLWALRGKRCFSRGVTDGCQQRAKTLYRKALDLARKTPSLDRALYCQLLVNYGNCLDSVWRRFEAVSSYEKALRFNPQMGEALGNKGIAVLGLAPLAYGHRHAFYLEAQRLLSAAVESSVDERMKRAFKPHLEYVQGVITAHGTMKPERSPNSAARGKFHQFLRNFCNENDLFLTPTIAIGDTGRRVYGDPIFISTMTGGLEDAKKFDRYVTFLNQIKQDYIFARYLLVQSQYRSAAMDVADQGVTLLDSLDYSLYGSYVQMLRTSFKLAVDVLDKIGYFVADYFKVASVSEQSIGFRTIFSARNTRLELRGELRSVHNPYLFALFDLALDLVADGDFERIYEYRNALTHRFLTVHDIDLAKLTDVPYIPLDKFGSDAVFAMQLARAAVIYLILMVDSQEKSVIGGPGPIVPVTSFPVSDLSRWKPRK